MKFFDLHCDTIWQQYKSLTKNKKHIKLTNNNLMVDQNKLIKGNYYAQCFAIYVSDKDNAFSVCKDMIQLYYKEINQCKSLSPVLKYSDFKKNEESNKISAVLTVENGQVLQGDISHLNELYKLGVKMICLTHNQNNCIGYNNYGGFVDSKPDLLTPNTTKGLTEFGRQVVYEMNKLGIIIDLSHISDKGFYDAISLSTKPVVCSHSNVRNLCPHVRNVTKEMLKKLASNGGLIGINTCKHFLETDNYCGEQTIDCMVEHVLYVRKLIGIEHLAIGTDFDGLDHEVEFSSCKDIPKLIPALSRAGLSTTEIEKIAYKNALRVFKTNMVGN